MSPVIVILLCLITVSYGAINEEEAKSIYDIAFDKRGFRRKLGLPPVATLQLLVQLNDFYTQEKKTGFQARVDALVEVSRIQIRKCGKENSERLDKLIESNKLSTLNIIPYLNQYRERQYYLCNKIISDFLEKNYAMLSEEDRRNMDLFRVSVAKPSFKAILKYIEKREGSLWNVSKEQFEELFDHDVKGLCQRVNAKINVRDHLGVRNFFIPKDFSSKMKSTTKEWLKSAQICGVYLKNINLLRPQVYDVYLKHQRKGFFGRLLNRMPGH